MGQVKKAGLFFVSLIANIAAGGVIYYFWRPIASWYFNYRPILGVDFYNLTSYVAYLARHFVFQFNGWKYTWWGGGPLSLDYPILHAYLVLPLLKWFSLLQAVQLYVLGSLFLFLFFSYLLFTEIGRDRVLAVVLALASSFSIGLYGGLIWGGGLQYLATQFFLPLILLALVKYFKSANGRWFYLAALLLGLSLLFHPLVGFSYTAPIALLLLLAYPLKREKFSFFKKIKRVLSFLSLAVLTGYPSLYLYFGRSPLEIISVLPNTLLRFLRPQEATRGFVSADGASQQSSSPVFSEIAQYQRNQLQRFFTDTNDLFFLMLLAIAIIFFLTFLIRKGKLQSLRAVIFALPVIWVVFYNSLFGFGIGLFHGGWYRVFWPFPLALGILISFVWGDFWSVARERLGGVGQKAVFSILIPLVSGVFILLPGAIWLSQNPAPQLIKKIETPGYRQQSSAFPDSLGVYIEKEEFENLKKRLIPSWLDPNDIQYRLYDGDQRVSIWWNALYDMPLVKGYVDLPPGDAFSGAYYWTSIALTQSGPENTLIKSWGFPEEMAYNNALFLIDWFSVKYLEAEHEKSDSYHLPSSYLVEKEAFKNKEKVTVPGWAQLYEVPVGQSIIWHPQEDEHLTYYEFKDELPSPIAHTTNASVVGFIGRHTAYNTFIRSLASMNINSRQIIPVRLGEFIDDIPYESLKDMDALILYEYDYKNHGKVWGRLENYVKEGGKVFIETGSEVKQTDSVNLPAQYPKTLPSIFPLKMTKKEEMGNTWQLSGENSKETAGINLENFGPPIIDDEPWFFSLPDQSGDLKEGAKVVLSNKGTPLIVSWNYGGGQVIWSGMNLPYHLTTHKSLEEAKFFEKLLQGLVDTSIVTYQNFTINRPSPNKVLIQGSGAKGVFFRENSNPGWTARVNGQKVRVYQAGPTFYGFSYARIPKEAQDSFVATFSYQGEFWVYFWTAVWFLTILALLDRILLGSRLLVPALKKIYHPVSLRVGKWWEKEEEE